MPLRRDDAGDRHRSGIEIDWCPQCRGVWLDRGELDKLMERSEGPWERGASDFRHSSADHGRRDAGRPRDRRKAMLREPFDF